MATKMGLTKEYLRYRPSGNFSIIASSNCNPVLLTLEQQEGRFIGVGAAEDVIVWDLRLGEKALILKGEKHQVTRLAASPDKAFVAVGYHDGTVKVFDLKTAEAVANFSGHRSAITCLVYDESGHRLASGANDTEIVLWDVVGETGLSRLSGHKGPVTALCFLPGRNVLASGSKDALVKFWDLDTSHCFKTLAAHRSEVWGLAVLQDRHLVTGSGDSELRVWTISENTSTAKPDAVDDPDDSSISKIRCTEAGSIMRSGHGRCVILTSDPRGQVLACSGTDKLVELFTFADEEKADANRKKRLGKLRKKREKALLEATEAGTEAEEAAAPNGEGEVADKLKETELSLKDIVRRLPVLQVETGRVKGVDIAVGMGEEMRLAVNRNNNCVELHTMSLAATAKPPPPQLLRRIGSQGHHSELRAVAFSSDNTAMLSASADSVKLWNRPSLTCLRTVAVPNVVSVTFAPGDRHALAGTKDGTLVIVDLQAGDVLEEIPAHGTELWALALTPDKRGCVTGGGDKTVKFWQFELVEEKPKEGDEESAANRESAAKVLSVLHMRTLKLDETVLALKMSPDGKFIAVALLDCTVKIFFADTFKFFVSLYGHKLPVLCLDISYDTKLIATGSSDRSIKVWGMDFGDCRRSLFAHDNSVTGLAFVHKSHLMFSCGKDGTVKHWDCRNYERIQTLRGHFGDARALCVSPDGRWVLTCGADDVLRLVERSAEILELSDERETEREEAADEEVARAEKTQVAGRGELALPSRKTAGSDRAADQLMECLDICSELEANPTAPKHPLMIAFRVDTAPEYLLHSLRMIRTSELQEALLLLPFATVSKLLAMLPSLLGEGHVGDCELVASVAVFLVSLHRGPISSSLPLAPTVRLVQRMAAAQVNRLRDLVGRNLHGLRFMQDRIEEREEIQLFTNAIENRKKPKGRKVIKRKVVRF